MPSSHETTTSQVRTYHRTTSITFRKTTEEFGGLSNMAAGFPLEVNGLAIRTAEALYQACRFPHRPDLQRLIIDQRSPMTAKMVGRPYVHDSRRDWDRVRVSIMRWCLRVKLAQNWSEFSELLLATGDRPIVEDSRRDDFWGAKQANAETLMGMNVLGRLLMELREEIRQRDVAELLVVDPPPLADWLLDGRSVGRIEGMAIAATSARPSQPVVHAEQRSFFEPLVSEESAVVEAGSRVDLPRYRAYYHSGVSWLGEVPAHWEVRRLKHVCSMRSGEGITSESIDPEGAYPVYGGNGLRGYTSSFTHKGTFPLVGRQGALCGNVHLARGQFWASEHAVVASPAKGVRPDFLARALQVMDLGQYSIAAAQPGLAVERILTLPTPLPPPDEQAAIVRYLDHVDRRTRRYIRAKQRLIALLEEQKQAIIHRAVTRGLDAGVRLKPSGVEWLGDIPEHWETRPAKSLFREVDERSESGSEELLSVSHLTGVTRRAEKTITMFMAASYAGHKVCRPGDLVINTMWAWMGALGCANETGIVSPSYAVYRPTHSDRMHPQFAEMVLKTRRYIDQYGIRSTGITSSRLRLYPDAFLRLPILLPPIEEQQTLLKYVEDATREIDAAIRTSMREMDFIREYRTRLITDVVTGKLDVREAAARLPNEIADEGDPLDDLDAIDDGLDALDEDAERAAALEEALT